MNYIIEFVPRFLFCGGLVALFLAAGDTSAVQWISGMVTALLTWRAIENERG